MTDCVLLRLDWPHKDLSSNARVHWASLARVKKESRVAAFAEANTRGIKNLGPGPYTLTFSYAPPDRRKRDAQNIPHMLKPAIDGIADALGEDDHDFRCVFPSQFEEPTKGGSILCEVRAE